MDAGEGVVESIVIHVINQILVAEKSSNLGKVFVVTLSADLTLNEHGPSFVEPEAFPILACHFIASP